jgi:hypothetical protein
MTGHLKWKERKGNKRRSHVGVQKQSSRASWGPRKPHALCECECDSDARKWPRTITRVGGPSCRVGLSACSVHVTCAQTFLRCYTVLSSSLLFSPLRVRCWGHLHRFHRNRTSKIISRISLRPFVDIKNSYFYHAYWGGPSDLTNNILPFFLF